MFTCPRTLCSRNPFLLVILFLSGNMNITICSLNIRSILHPLHSTALSDLIDAHNPDLSCLTETWIKPTTTSAELLYCRYVAYRPLVEMVALFQGRSYI